MPVLALAGPSSARALQQRRDGGAGGAAGCSESTGRASQPMGSDRLTLLRQCSNSRALNCPHGSSNGHPWCDPRATLAQWLGGVLREISRDFREVTGGAAYTMSLLWSSFDVTIVLHQWGRAPERYGPARAQLR